MEDNREKLKQLFDQYCDDIYKAVYFLCLDAELTEKIVSETFIQAYKSLDTLEDSEEVKKTLIQLATSLCKDCVNRDKCHHPVTLLDQYELRGTQLYADEFEGNLRSFLSDPNIDPLTREVLILYHFNELSYDEISEQIHIDAEIIKYKIELFNELLHKQLKKFSDSDLGQGVR